MDNALTKEIQKLIDFSKEKSLLLQQSVQIINKEQVKVILLVTEYSIYVFKPNEAPQPLEILSSHAINTLKSGERQNNNILVLNYENDSQQFISAPNDLVLETIELNLRWILLPREFPKLKTKLGPASPTKDRYPNIVERYRAKKFWTGIPATKEEISYIRKYVSDRPKFLKISYAIQNKLDLAVFLAACELEISIDKLMFDHKLDKSQSDVLIQYITLNSTIQTLIFSQEMDDEIFDKIFLAISSNNSTFINSICFENIKLSSHKIQAISTFIEDHRIDLLSMIKCDILSHINLVVEMISQHGTNITKLKIQSINIYRNPLHVGEFTNITHLQLRRCGVDVGNFLNQLSLYSKTRIEAVDLSYNFATEKISEKCNLPFSMSRLVLENIEWNENNFANLLKVATSAPSQISLHLGGARLIDNDWDSVFKTINQLNPTHLLCLGWRENPVHQNFADFIEKSSNLAYLSIAGCPNIHATRLLDVVAQHPSLQLLDCHGTSNNKLGPVNGQIILKLKNSKTLRRFDISNNNLGSSLMSKIYTILPTIKHLRVVLLDKNDIQQSETFNDLISFLTSRKEATCVQFPEFDIKHLVELKLISESQVNKSKNLFKKPSPMGIRCPYMNEWQQLIDKKYPEDEYIEEYLDTSLDEMISDEPTQTETDEPPESINSSYERRWTMDFIDLPHNDNAEVLKTLSDRYNIEYLCQTLFNN